MSAANSILATVPGPDTFTGLCATIRRRVDDLELTVVREFLAISDMLVDAKLQYELETGTGHGNGKGSRVIPFVRKVADEIDRSPGFVKRLLALARIDPDTRRIIENAQGVSMAALLDLAREADLTRQLRAATALADGGRAAMKKAMSPLADRREADPAFDKLLNSITDPTETLGGLPGEMPVPASLVNVYPELDGYETMGELRAAIKSGKVSRRAHREHEDAVEPEVPTAKGLAHLFKHLSDAEQARFLTLVGAAWVDTILGEEDVIDDVEPNGPEIASIRIVEPANGTDVPEAQPGLKHGPLTFDEVMTALEGWQGGKAD